MLEFEVEQVSYASIKVVGCGGAGGNAVNRMVEEGLRGVDFIAINTDLQSLQASAAPTTTPATTSWVMVSRFRAYASTTVAYAAAATSADQTIACRRSHRSTNAPAGTPATTIPATTAPPTRPASAALSVIHSASSGKANPLIREPMPFNVLPTMSNSKSRLRHNAGRLDSADDSSDVGSPDDVMTDSVLCPRELHK